MGRRTDVEEYEIRLRKTIESTLTESEGEGFSEFTFADALIEELITLKLEADAAEVEFVALRWRVEALESPRLEHQKTHARPVNARPVLE
jgi:hypothetical protein